MASSGGGGWRQQVLRAVPVALTAPLYGCLFFVSTSPTPLSQANIVIVVRTVDSGIPIVGARVRVQAGGSNEGVGEGLTDRDGRVFLSVSRDVRSLRVLVETQTGFVVPASTSGPVEVPLPSGTDEVTIFLRPPGT
jgi:hypothetical protein